MKYSIMWIFLVSSRFYIFLMLITGVSFIGLTQGFAEESKLPSSRVHFPLKIFNEIKNYRNGIFYWRPLEYYYSITPAAIRREFSEDNKYVYNTENFGKMISKNLNQEDIKQILNFFRIKEIYEFDPRALESFLSTRFNKKLEIFDFSRNFLIAYNALIFYDAIHKTHFSIDAALIYLRNYHVEMFPESDFDPIFFNIKNWILKDLNINEMNMFLRELSFSNTEKLLNFLKETSTDNDDFLLDISKLIDDIEAVAIQKYIETNTTVIDSDAVNDILNTSIKSYYKYFKITSNTSTKIEITNQLKTLYLKAAMLGKIVPLNQGLIYEAVTQTLNLNPDIIYNVQSFLNGDDPSILVYLDREIFRITKITPEKIKVDMIISFPDSEMQLNNFIDTLLSMQQNILFEKPFVVSQYFDNSQRYLLKENRKNFEFSLKSSEKYLCRRLFN